MNLCIRTLSRPISMDKDVHQKKKRFGAIQKSVQEQNRFGVSSFGRNSEDRHDVPILGSNGMLFTWVTPHFQHGELEEEEEEEQRSSKICMFIIFETKVESRNPI
uniref:Uncharacterized protein n=1 Tax=Cacopsylla melanoneura TaxID=428564 RepID=A0A8D9AL48_9HEMI